MTDLAAQSDAQEMPATARPAFRPIRLRAAGRLIALALAATCFVVLFVATRVSPDASGMNTHAQLGMKPCGFLESTGVPCATCGMTTSFAHFVRGQFVDSVLAQPFAPILAFGTAMTFWIALHAAVTGRPAYRMLKRLPAMWIIGVLLTLWLAAWAWKIFEVVGRTAR